MAKPNTTSTPASTLTDEQLLRVISQGTESQEFAELSMNDKLRAMTLQNKALQAANAALVEQNFDQDGLKIGTSGTLSLQITGSYPVSLYRDQWPKVIQAVKSGAIERWLAKNEPRIINKPAKEKK